MFRYIRRLDNPSMFNRADDLDGIPIRQKDLESLGQGNYQIVEGQRAQDIRDKDEYGNLLIDDLVAQGQEHLKDVDNEIARQASIRKEVQGIQRLNEEFAAGEKQLARVMRNEGLFRQAGVPEGMIDKEIGAKKATFKKGVEGIPFGKPLDRLYAGQGEPVPAPLVFEKDGMTRRVFTRYEENPVTGVLEVVPVMDGNKAQAIDLGMYPIERKFVDGKMRNVPVLPGGHGMANEMVMEHALKLMGEGKVGLNNLTSTNYSDFARTDARGNRRQTEGMIRASDGYGTETVAIPSHTMLVPSKQELPEVTKDVRKKVKDEMSRNRVPIIKATENLVERGELGPNTGHRYGKLLRADKNRMAGEEVYDELIISGYPIDLQKDTAFKTNALAVAPDSLHLAKNLDAVRRLAERVTDPSKIATGPDNGGLYGDRTPRSKMQVILPIKDQLFTDMAVKYPQTMQLLNDYSQYVI